MKKLVIPAILLCILGGGGFAAGEEGGKNGSSVDEPKFVALDPLTAPFIRGGRFAHYVVLVVNLEVADSNAKNAVNAFMPRLRDAFVTELHTIAAMRNPKQKMLNIKRIKTRLLASARKVMGDGVVRDVLVQIAR